MDRDELKQINQKQQQRLVNRSPEQLKRANTTQQQRLIESENVDTVKQNSRPSLIAGIVVAGFLVATAVGVGSQFKLLTKGKTAPQTAPNAAVNNNAAPTAVSPQKEQEGQMLLGQAQLLAQQGQPQQLAQAISITQKIPTGVAVTPQAQSLATTWGQNIIDNANTAANGGTLSEAIAIAQLVPANSPKHQQAQQQIQQWQQQQAQANQAQFDAALAEASQPTPLPPLPEVTPAPPATTTTTTPTVAPTPETQTQTATQSQPAIDNAATTQTQTAQIKRPTDDGKQVQALANDPYLNVKIPQANAPQVQSKAVSSSTVALNSNTNINGNSYGFGNMVTKASTVAIKLRDNVDEDGDFVSLIVNDQVYTSNRRINNYGNVIMVDLLPGENKVEIEGIRDGGGGITLEVNVAGVGNINETPIPEGSTASFIINRE